MKKIVYWTTIRTTQGKYVVMATEKGICWVGFHNDSVEKGKEWVASHIKNTKFIEDESFPVLKEAEKALIEYFGGKKSSFNLAFDLYLSEFQKKILNEMIKIPFGKTKTYKELAVSVGNPNASRAVGMACRTNPVAIFIPCHRVVGSNGKLTGYAGGLSTKEWLLQLEQGAAGQTSIETF